jgi:glycosyltransferase involved in cell wall biosynthesis
MKISVLTVSRNAADTIRRTLDSFFAQDYPDKELVLIDGASCDATVSIAQAYPQDGMHVLSESDEGMYDALNKALALYTGAAVGALNADDAFHDRAVLSRIAEGLARADMVHGHLDFVDRRQVVLRRWRATPHRRNAFRRGWMPAHPTFYVRRRVAEAVGKFDLGLRIAADYDWMLRAVELHDFSLATIDAVLVDMRHGGVSTSGPGAWLKHNLEALRSRRRWLAAGAVDYALFAKPVGKLTQLAALTASARAK